MKIVIVGAGEVGFYLAKMLSIEKHDIVVLEVDREKLARVQEQLDVLAVEGDGVSLKCLMDAGLDHADMLVAVTSIDEVNIVSCLLASKLGVKRKVARVRNQEYTQPGALVTPEQMGIDLMINPEVEATEAILSLVRRSYATDVIDYQAEGMQVLGLRIDSRTAPIVGRPLQELTQEFPDLVFRTVAIYRNGKTIIPKGKDVVYFRDQIFVVAKTASIPAVLKVLGKEDVTLSNVMILGGGRVGRMLARKLEEMKNVNVKLVESNRDTSRRLAGEFRKTLVLQGDGTDIDLLATEGISEMDVYVAATDDDEDNLVSCLLAKHLGVRRVLALINKSEYLPIINTIGLDAAVSPKVTTADTILRYVRRGRVVSVATLKEIDAEVIEMVAQPKSPITRKPLKGVKLPHGAIIGAIFRNGESTIPVGASQLQADDRAVVFALPEAIGAIEEAFS